MDHSNYTTIDFPLAEVLECIGTENAPALRALLDKMLHEPRLTALSDAAVRSETLLIPGLGTVTISRGVSRVGLEMITRLQDTAVIQVGLAGGYWAGREGDINSEFVAGRELYIDLQPGKTSHRMRTAPKQYINRVFFACPRRLLIDELGLVAGRCHPKLATFLRGHLEDPESLRFPLAESIAEAVHELLESSTSTLPERRKAEGLALVCLAEIGSFLNLTGRSPATLDKPEKNRLDGFEQARMLIKARIDAPPSIDELAAHVAMSRSRLTRGFKARYGLTINTYTHRVRMHHARSLLRNEELPVGYVARRLGYTTSGNFARDYRRCFGYAPSGESEHSP